MGVNLVPEVTVLVLNNMKKLFTSHPNSVGESYFEHLWTASCFSTSLLIASLACLVHGLFPFFFTQTGSRRITTLYEQMVKFRQKKNPSNDGLSSKT